MEIMLEQPIIRLLKVILLIEITCIRNMLVAKPLELTNYRLLNTFYIPMIIIDYQVIFIFYNVTFNNDSIVIEETTEHKNFIYNFIDKKKESMDNYLEDIKNSRKLERNELYQLGIDSTKVEVNEKYYRSPDAFLSRENPYYYGSIYYRQKYGDETMKVLQFNHNDTIKEITLGIVGGDSDSYKMTSEFVNDSIFIQSLVNQETIVDTNDTMGYAFDSIVTKFKYNERFELDTISKDTFKYKKYQFQKVWCTS